MMTSTRPTGTSIERTMEMLESRFTEPLLTSSQELMPAPTSTSTPSNGAGENERSDGSPSASQHSFSFDAPTTNSSASVSHLSGGTGNHLDKSLVRSKRRKSTRTTLGEVHLAAERQMQRVLASSPLMINSSLEVPSGSRGESASKCSTVSALASPGISNTSLSNQTLLTSHLKLTTAKGKQPPSAAATTAAKVVAESPPTLVSPTLQPGMPVAHKPRVVRPSGSQMDKRKSVPVRRPMNQSKPTKSSTPPGRKRTRLNFNDSPSVRSTTSANEGGKDRSHHGTKKSKLSNSKAGVAFSSNNNAFIHDFFSVTTKSHQSQPMKVQATAASTATGETSINHSNDQKALTGELQHLKAKCHELEQQIKEKDSQLKAVSNNQTMVHVALQDALRKRGEELESTKSKMASLSGKTSGIIEELVREKSLREASDLRVQLASDSTRLGRIVQKRAGIPVRWTEEWEEGEATKAMKKREKELLDRRRAFAEQHTAVAAAATTVREGHGPVTINGNIVLADELSVMEAEGSLLRQEILLQRLEEEIQAGKTKLLRETALHIRALKRDQNEKESRFNKRPKLNDRYVLLSLLGKGGFSEVWRAYDLVDNIEVAVKIHQLDNRWSDAKKDSYTKHVSREYEIHRDVRHPRIVSLLDVFEIDNNSFATVLEVCKGTDLDTLLKFKKQLSEVEAKAILLQILSGMQYLSTPSGNRQGIIHYDLKPGNILFDENDNAKITDFGLSKIVDAPDPGGSMELTSQGAGTYWYLPPECLDFDHAARISNKVDVWSIGVIFYQMLFGKRPYGNGLSQDQVVAERTILKAREGPKFPSDTNVSMGAKDFITSCLTYEQALRPTIGQLCQHSYIIPKKEE